MTEKKPTAVRGGSRRGSAARKPSALPAVLAIAGVFILLPLIAFLVVLLTL